MGTFPRTAQWSGKSREAHLVPEDSYMLLDPQIWYFLEGGYDVYRIVPSQGWSTYFNLQKLEKSPLYSNDETLVSLFYEKNHLYEVPGGFGKVEMGSRLGATRRSPRAYLPASGSSWSIFLTTERNVWSGGSCLWES